MQLSIVIPLFNESDSLNELVDWITDVMQRNAISYELLFIDDGSTDDSWLTLTRLCASSPQIRALRFTKNFGKSQALHAGFKLAQGKIVATMMPICKTAPKNCPR